MPRQPAARTEFSREIRACNIILAAVAASPTSEAWRQKVADAMQKVVSYLSKPEIVIEAQKE